MNSINQLAQGLRAARDAGRPFYAFTGAGLSTDSGLPDFRSATGMWSDKVAEHATSVEGFDENPESVWRLFVEPVATLDLRPNAGHLALARLVEAGLISRVVTQNVDDLHEQAGVARDLVDHLHGTLERAECHDCLRAWPLMEVAQPWLAGGPLPTCEECGEPLQPSITLFGQMLPQRAWRNAERVARQSGGVLVCGTTLAVHPACDLPRATGKLGRPVAIINRGPTEMDEMLDPEIDYRLDGSGSELLAQLAEAAAPS